MNTIVILSLLAVLADIKQSAIALAAEQNGGYIPIGLISGRERPETGIGEADKLIELYFPKEDWKAAKAVVACESGGNPKATNINSREESRGIFQINLKAHSVSSEEAHDPLFSVKWAKEHWDDRARLWKNCWEKIK